MKETGYRQIWGTVFGEPNVPMKETGYRQIWGTVFRATLLFCVVIALAVGWFRVVTLDSHYPLLVKVVRGIGHGNKDVFMSVVCVGRERARWFSSNGMVRGPLQRRVLLVCWRFYWSCTIGRVGISSPVGIRLFLYLFMSLLGARRVHSSR